MPNTSPLTLTDTSRLDKLKNFCWYKIFNERDEVLIASETKNGSGRNYVASVNRYASLKPNLKNVTAHFQVNNNILYFQEEDFYAYFASRTEPTPLVKEGTEELRSKFLDKKIKSVINSDNKYLKALPRLTWYSLARNGINYFIAKVNGAKYKKSALGNFAKATTRFARSKNLTTIKVSRIENNALLFMKEDSFNAYFEARGPKPQVIPATEDITQLFIQSKKFKQDSIKQNLIDLSWTRITVNGKPCIVSKVDKEIFGENSANRFYERIKYYVRKNKLKDVNYFTEKKRNLVGFTETGFSIFFKSLQDVLPEIKIPTTQNTSVVCPEPQSSPSDESQSQEQQLRLEVLQRLQELQQLQLITQLQQIQIQWQLLELQRLHQLPEPWQFQNSVLNQFNNSSQQQVSLSNPQLDVEKPIEKRQRLE